MFNAKVFNWHGMTVVSSMTAEEIDRHNAILLDDAAKNDLPYYPYIPMVILGNNDEHS